MECLQMTCGLDVILMEIMDYGRQDNGNTPNTSPRLYGKWKVKYPLLCATPTGTGVNQTMLKEMRHVSICGKITATPGATNRATSNTASSARTTEFQSGGLKGNHAPLGYWNDAPE